MAYEQRGERDFGGQGGGGGGFEGGFGRGRGRRKFGPYVCVSGSRSLSEDEAESKWIWVNVKNPIPGWWYFDPCDLLTGDRRLPCNLSKWFTHFCLHSACCIV
jgi:hypothetical protein